MIMLLLHPGDLGVSGLLKLLAMLVVLFGLPVVIIGFIIYKIATRKRDEFQTGITKKE